MTYRSVLGPYQKPRATTEASTPSATELALTTPAPSGGANQEIYVADDILTFIGRKTFTVDLLYDNDRNDATLSGISFRVFFNSQKLNLVSVVSGIDNFQGYTINSDSSDFDVDPTTDSYIQLFWFDTNGRWPNIPLPSAIARLTFVVDEDVLGDTTTNINFTPAQTALGYSFKADTVPIEIHHLTWDIDENGEIDALTDGLMLLRALFGIADTTDGTMSLNSPLTKGQANQNAYDVKFNIADIDGDGFADALTDGLLLLRYLFDLSGDSLLRDAVSLGATRTTEEEIIGYIEKYITPVIYPDDNGGRDYGTEFVESDNGSAVKAFVSWSKVELATSFTNITASAMMRRAAPSVVRSTYGALIKSASVSSIASIVKPKLSISYSNPSISLIEISRGTAFRDFADLLVATDNLVSAVGKHLNSTFGISDQTFFVSSTKRSHLSDVSLLDDITTLFGYGRIVDDTVSIADAPSMAVTKQFIDNIRLDSFFEDSYGNITDKANLATLTDTVSVLAIFKRKPNENVFLLDTHTFDVAKSITEDPLLLSDSAEFITGFKPYNDDPISFGDSHTFAATKGLSDTLGLFSDFSRQLDARRDFTDEAIAFEVVSIGVEYRRPILDTIRLDSFPTLDEANFADKSNLATLTDSVSRQASYNRAPTDDIDLSEDIRFGRGIYHADSVSFSDSILSSVGFNTFPEDIFEFTRSFTKVRFTKAAQDSFEFADSKSFDVATNFVDESFAAEAVNIGVKYRRPILDKLRLDSFPEIAGSRLVDKANLATVTDIVAFLAAFDRVTTDDISLLSTSELGVGKLEQELLDIADTVEIASGIARAHLDNVGLLDDQFFGYGKNPTDTVTTNSQLSFDVTKPQEDIFDVDEDVSFGIKYRRPILDTVRLDSFPTLAEANFADKSNLATLSDTISTISGYNRSSDETLSLASHIEKDVGTLQSDSLLLSDDPELAFGYNRSHSDSFSISDISVSAIGKGANDVVNVTSQVVFGFGNTYVTDATVSETFLSGIKYRRPILDTIRLDSFPTLAEANFADKSNLATLSDTITIAAYYNRLFTDPVSLESALSFDATTLKSDSFSFNDTVSRSIGFGRIFDTDEVALDSNVNFAAGKNHTDVVSIISQTRLSVSSNTTDSLPTTEAISIGVKYRRPILDKLRLDSFPTIAESNFADKANIATITDSISLFTQYNRSASDVVSVATDSVILDVAKNIVSETLELVDTASLAVGFVREVSLDTFAYDDSITFGQGFNIVEQNTVTDTVQKSLNSRLTDDDLFSSEYVLNTVEYRRPILDTFRLDDSVIASDQNYRDKSNLATLTDSVTTEAGFYRTAGLESLSISSDISLTFTKSVTTETFNFIDSILFAVGFNKDIFDGVTLNDAVVTGPVSSSSDAVSLTETAAFGVGKPLESISDIQEQFSIRTKYRRPVVDTIRLDSFPTIAESNFADKANLATLTDSVILESGFAKSPTDTVSITSSLKMSTTKQIPTDIFNISDSITHAVTRRIPDLLDPLSLSDGATFSIANNPTESLGLTDEITIELLGGVNPISAIDSTENISKIIKYRRPLRDQLTFADDLTLELTVGDSASRAINTSVINSDTIN